MNRGGFGGELLETGQQTVKSIAKTPADLAKQAVSQASSGAVATSSDNAGTNEQGAGQQAQQQQLKQQEIEQMYGINQQATQAAQTPQAQNIQTGNPGQSEQERMAEVRQKLAEHKKLHTETYFEPTFNRPAPKEESVQEEHEREEQEEQMKLMEEEEKKPKEIPAHMRNKGEFKGGVGG